MHEQEPEPRVDNASGEPLNPSPLPDDLAQFLARTKLACLTCPTDRGTVLIVKLPNQEINSIRGPVPISFRHELYEYPSAPVIRMVTTIYDQPARPLALETFINVGDPEQHGDYENLSKQEILLMLFYDEALRHRLTKAVAGQDQQAMVDILGRADRILSAISPEEFDFDRAKAGVMASIDL